MQHFPQFIEKFEKNHYFFQNFSKFFQEIPPPLPSVKHQTSAI